MCLLYMVYNNKYVYLSIHNNRDVCLSIHYIYIYIYIEREREMYIHIYVDQQTLAQACTPGPQGAGEAPEKEKAAPGIKVASVLALSREFTKKGLSKGGFSDQACMFSIST